MRLKRLPTQSLHPPNLSVIDRSFEINVWIPNFGELLKLRKESKSQLARKVLKSCETLVRQKPTKSDDCDANNVRRTMSGDLIRMAI